MCAAGALAAPLLPSTATAATPPLQVPPVAQQTGDPGLLVQMREAGTDLQVDRHLRIARVHARVQGDRLNRPERHRLRDRLEEQSPRAIRRRTRDLRRDLRELRARTTAQAAEGGVAVPGQLQAIAACESGGDPGAVDPSGTYRGKYQFDQGTWSSVGGSGDPAAAPEAEQDRLAAKLYEQAGAGRWPVCGS